ncbi:MAG: hypothetical protein IPG61_04390 [bacterium]|nr:hypothetical protein [bacterium]
MPDGFISAFANGGASTFRKNDPKNCLYSPGIGSSPPRTLRWWISADGAFDWSAAFHP